MLSTRSLCNIGVLFHAVRLIKRGWDDSRLVDHLFGKYACGRREQYVEIVALAHRGIDAAEYLGRLRPEDELPAELVPQLPG